MYRLIFIIGTLLIGDTVRATSSSEPAAVDSDAPISARQARQYWPYGINPYQGYPVGGSVAARRSAYRNSPLLWNNEFQDAGADQDNEAQFRQNPFGLSNINSAVNIWAQLFNSRPRPVIPNPNAPANNAFTRLFSNCVDGSGLSGVCAPASLCSRYGGRPSGSCGLGSVCCINSVTTCGGQITLNNTFWRSPPAISPDTSCSLTVTLDTNLIEQKLPACQIRLDFVSFSIAQPEQADAATATRCLTDTFVVGGVTNRVPVICGDNPNQHMYLTPPSSTTDLLLLFTFGRANVARSWNIKVSYIPCGSNMLAPADCLQYFTQASGSVKSFNWIDAGGLRQLANQDYKVCFRNELINNKRATRICYSACSVNSGGNPFEVSTLGGGVTLPGSGLPTCNADFLIIPDGTDSAGGVADRFCGASLSAGVAAGSLTTCSTVKDFTFIYRTDGFETANEMAAAALNTGFCLTFEERLN